MTAVGATTLIGVSSATAATDTTKNTIVDRLVSKFNLNKAEVQKVFDEERAAHQAEHQAKVSERLQKLVDDKTITSDQKTAIESKLKELQSKREANREAFKDLSEDQREAKMNEERTALESWAKEQGLDLTKLRGIFGPGGHGRHMGPPPEGN